MRSCASSCLSNSSAHETTIRSPVALNALTSEPDVPQIPLNTRFGIRAINAKNIAPKSVILLFIVLR